MYLFRWHPEAVQSSLRSSMKYMYVEDVSLGHFYSAVFFIANIRALLYTTRYSDSDHWDSIHTLLVRNE